jgi:hypothetical protein
MNKKITDFIENIKSKVKDNKEITDFIENIKSKNKKKIIEKISYLIEKYKKSIKREYNKYMFVFLPTFLMFFFGFLNLIILAKISASIAVIGIIFYLKEKKIELRPKHFILLPIIIALIIYGG